MLLSMEKTFLINRLQMIQKHKIKKITTGQADDYTTDYFLDYNYFNKPKMIAVDLNKHQALDVNPKAIQQINILEISVVIIIY